MVTFLCAVVLLCVAYFTYGKFVEKTFGADANRPTPATTQADGVDFVPMNTMKVYLIQFLNIAGLGPIFGPIMGALYGPAAFLWIIVGSIFAGGVHDYMSGMMSVRTGGKSIAEISGNYLGEYSRYAMLFISVMLLLFVGVVFIVGPAALLANLTFDTSGKGVFEGTIFANKVFWISIIFAYYFISTIVPVDKVIGKIYPLFGAVLMFMAFGVGGAMLFHGLAIPELTDISSFTHPAGIPIWPALFFTISCGALSGFHATQSPLMARTIKNETLGRKVFYGAMISEAVIAMIWAAVGMAYFPEGINGLSGVLAQGGPGLVVNKITVGYLGIAGGLLAILGVIVAPITSGDTAFRSIRLTISDRFNMPQAKIVNRLMIAVPIFVIAFLITQIGFKAIWMYFTFSNQLLSTFVLWTATAYLYQHGRNFWISALPGVFMSSSLVGYILTAKEFPFGLSHDIAVNSGIVTAIVIMIYLIKIAISRNSIEEDSQPAFIKK
ncbi:carbon starvation CstA family protein [Sulfurospirillum arcachonense]|uniref:carbon starvation CstA family protein n=1 Tax=Sulfurospirillum arcachonense TaxID=57666 RepID=UPI00046AE43D|nr:carbon starvation protein A [Sulfurospirillum arcachonense]